MDISPRSKDNIPLHSCQSCLFGINSIDLLDDLRGFDLADTAYGALLEFLDLFLSCITSLGGGGGGTGAEVGYVDADGDGGGGGGGGGLPATLVT